MADGTELTVLVCSANVGNAEPTPASFGEWVPNDGEIEGPLSSTKYPVEANGAKEACSSLTGTGKKFDIIVLGMQEAAFVDKSLKKKNGGAPLAEESTSGVGSTEHESERGPNNVLDAMGNGVADVEKEVKKKKNKLFRKVVKANLVVRGLTTSQTYKSPTIRHTGRNSQLKENHAVRSGAYDTRKFQELIDERCPSYEMVTAKLRGEMRLIVLALKDLAEEISDVYIAGENTGIGGVMANKGGIIATFDLRGTRLSFMTAHLEAHEGGTHYINRNKNLAEIFAGAKTDPNYNLHDATIISHHMFVCGDLNYRIKFGSGPDSPKKKGDSKKIGKGKSMKIRASGIIKKQFSKKLETSDTDRPSAPPFTIEDLPDDGEPVETTEKSLDVSTSERGAANGSHFGQAKALVEAEDWKTLNDGDELAMALKKKECLVGFNTLPCNFPPTFKVARCEGYEYNEKRTPSYTDRILWKSADGMKDNVVPFLYEPCPDFITSDHKPIRGGYVVKMNRGPSAELDGGQGNDRQIHFLVSDIKCSNLPIMDSGIAGGLSDPYILFVSSPKPLLWKKAWPSTKVIKRNLNPVWEEDIHLTLDQDSGPNTALNGAMLYMTVIDEDISSGDDVIGTVALNMNDLCSELDMDCENEHCRSSIMGNRSSTVSNVQMTKISRPILRNCQEYGVLECTITSAYLTSRETKAFLKRARKVRSKTRHTSLTNKIFGMLPF